MITDKIKALFQFIEFLHSNIGNFNQYNYLINELEDLYKKRDELNPRNNYRDKLRYDEVQAELKSKFKVLQDNTANLIKGKAIELNVCNFEKEPDYYWFNIQNDIQEVKENFHKKDLSQIFKYKNKYLEYRTQTHRTFLSLDFFFEDLDEIAKSLFDFFKDSVFNEFEAFEIKTIEANNINDAIKYLGEGKVKVLLPDDFLNTSLNAKNTSNTINLDNVKVNFVDVYKKEVTPERKEELQSQLEKYKTIQEKIFFLKQERIKYLQNITPETFEASGCVTFPNFQKGDALFLDRYIDLEIQRLELLNSNETTTEEEEDNDFTHATIEDYLFQFKDKMSKGDYENLISALKRYLETGIFPTLSRPIQINSRPNKKRFGWALNRIFEAKGKGVEKELLLFAKQNISLFADVDFDENDIFNSNLYKYFTTKTE